MHHDRSTLLSLRDGAEPVTANACRDVPCGCKEFQVIRDIYGPTDNEAAARDTAKAIGANCSVYSRAVRDADGYDTDARSWFVEQDDSKPSGKIFGYEKSTFMARQYK